MKWIELYGVPNSVYVGLKSVYVSPVGYRNAFIDNKVNFSVLEKVCNSLGITIIKAYSAQAKGHVERKHRVFQHRFVKELHSYNIKDIESANNYLERKFLPHINAKFAHDINQIKNMHRVVTVYGDINEILCWQYPRILKNNWTIQHENEHYQIQQSSSPLIHTTTATSCAKKILIRAY